MPKYDKVNNKLIFTTEESEASCCPVCGGDPDYDVFVVLDDSVKYPWSCGECGAEGSEYAKLVFDGHQVDFNTVSQDTQLEYTEIKTLCINGTLRVGDLVLSTIDDDLPCLPGVVKAIEQVGTPEHDTENETDDVHVDFTGNYPEQRKREIEKAYACLFGYDRPFEEVSDDDLIMDPASLINITGIDDDMLRWIMESEENAIKYAYRVVREMSAQSVAAEE